MVQIIFYNRMNLIARNQSSPLVELEGASLQKGIERFIEWYKQFFTTYLNG